MGISTDRASRRPLRALKMDKEALVELVGFLNHERDDVAQAALQGLAETASSAETQTNLRDTDIVAQLVLCLAREDHTIRTNALVCVINLGADQILSEAMIAGEIVAGVVNIAVSKHSETEKPEAAALLDLCSKALINCTRMEAGSESLLSLPEESGMVLKTMKALAVAEENNETGSSIHRLQLAQILQNLAAVEVGQMLMVEQELWVIRELLPGLWDRPQPLQVRVASLGALKNTLNAIRRVVPLVLEVHSSPAGSPMIDALARAIEDLHALASAANAQVKEVEVLRQLLELLELLALFGVSRTTRDAVRISTILYPALQQLDLALVPTQNAAISELREGVKDQISEVVDWLVLHAELDDAGVVEQQEEHAKVAAIEAGDQ